MSGRLLPVQAPVPLRLGLQQLLAPQLHALWSLAMPIGQITSQITVEP